MPPVVRIVGCGRWSMGDDQAGLVAADRLAERNLPYTLVARDETPGTELACELSGEVKLLVVIDAALADEAHPVGSSARIDYRIHPDYLSAELGGNTHTLGVATGLELAEKLGLLPAQVWVYAIFGRNFNRRLGLSPATEAGIAPLAARIERDVKQWLVTHVKPGPYSETSRGL